MSTQSGGQAQITLTEEEGMWVAEHAETGVASQGETPQQALEMLLEAVALYRSEAGDGIDSPEAEREVLADLGLDPDEIERARAENDDLPEFMQ
jgi:predicted RNase H-like HicB family nuclease